MDTVKATGKSVDEALRAAAEILRAMPEELEYKVLAEAGGGILGIGGHPAEVEAWLRKNDPERAKEIVQKILDLMGFMSLVAVVEDNAEGVSLEIKGEDLGRIIGKQGQALDALQMLAGMILGRILGRRYRVTLDAAAYREKRNKVLEKIAQEAEDKVKTSGQEVALEPMPASERRIIHLTLQNSGAVFTFSEGDRSLRRVVVAPKEKEPEIKEELDIEPRVAEDAGEAVEG
jgi:spoIIIJ-associated protein